MATVKQRVALGIALLDGHTPDWREFVAVNEFDIRNPCRCVLGQVFARPASRASISGFSRGIDKLRIFTAADYGFDAKWRPGQRGSCERDFNALQREWLKRLAVPA